VQALLRSSVLDQRIIVVDNGGDDTLNHHRLRAQLGAVAEVVATGANLGFAAGNNVGLRMALAGRCEFAWVLNPDLRVEPDTLERLLATATTVRDAGAIGPRIVHGGSDPVRIWCDGGRFDRLGIGATGNVNDGRQESEVPPGPARDVDYVVGACLLLRVDAVRDVGLLPEDYFMYFEETDYCQRLSARGWRLLVDPRARAVHHKRSSGALPTVSYLYYMRRNKELFAGRHGLDVPAAMSHFQTGFVDRWRGNVAQRAPDWVEVFDQVLALAEQHARAGLTGRCDALADFPAAVAVDAR